MATLNYRRGAWELRYRDPAGAQRRERFHGPSTRRAPEEAAERRAEIERELRHGTYVSREQRAATFGEYFQRWSAARSISRTRAYTDESRARLHVLPYWQTRRLCEIRPSDIDDWIATLTTGMGSSSVRHCYTLLRGPIRRAVRDGIITDPLIDIQLPAKPKIRKSFDDVLSREEVQRLVAHVGDTSPGYTELKTNDRYRALILMGCWLGPRWNEALGLRVCDLNPLKHEIAFGRVVINENGGVTFAERLNKTEEHRTVPCPTPIMDALLEHLHTYTPTGDRDRFLFLTGRDSHPKRSNFSRDVLKPALHRAALDQRRITWLSLRHTAASLMFDAGLTIFDVQQRLGHHSPTLTADVYTHLMRERHNQGRQLLENYITGNIG